MFCRKFIIFISLILVPFACNANNVLWKKSNLLSASGNYEEAASAIELMAQSNNEFALLRYAYLKYLQGEYGDSIKYYNKAIKVNPKSIDAKLGITLPMMAQKRWRDVKSYALGVLAISRWNYIAHVRLMTAEEGLMKWTTLIKHAEQLASIYPSDTTALVYLARGHVREGEVDAAKATYEKVLIRMPMHVEASKYLKSH